MARKPTTVQREIAELRELLDLIEREYPLVHDFAYTPGGMPGNESGRGSPRVDYSDPTGETAMPDRAEDPARGRSIKELSRRRVAAAGRNIAAMVACARVAVTHLQQGMPRDRDTYEQTPAYEPVVTTRQELADAIAAQERRRDRGEM